MDAFLHNSYLSEQDDLRLSFTNCSPECSNIDTSEPPGIVLDNDTMLWTSADHNSPLSILGNASPRFMQGFSQESVQSASTMQLVDPKEHASLLAKTIGRTRRRKQNIKEVIRKDEELEFVEIEAVGSANRRASRILTDITNIHRRTKRSSGRTTPFWSLTTYPTVDNEMNRQKQLRQVSITMKLQQNIDARCVVFTEQEEIDIFNRIESFLKDVEPCPQYCSEEGNQTVMNDKQAKTTPISNSIYWQYSSVGNSISNHRKASSNIPQYYVIKTESYVLGKDHECCPNLPIGTVLQKPTSKLVELVAQAIDDSPDGLLQVQQVYQYLMKCYPYFYFMSKSATNSWRSSVRHALYQKWFRKIQFTQEHIANRSCFWAINRQQHPKEWQLPPSTSRTEQTDEEAQPMRSASILSVSSDRPAEPMDTSDKYHLGAKPVSPQAKIKVDNMQCDQFQRKSIQYPKPRIASIRTLAMSKHTVHPYNLNNRLYPPTKEYSGLFVPYPDYMQKWQNCHSRVPMNLRRDKQWFYPVDGYQFPSPMPHWYPQMHYQIPEQAVISSMSDNIPSSQNNMEVISNQQEVVHFTQACVSEPSAWSTLRSPTY